MRPHCKTRILVSIEVARVLGLPTLGCLHLFCPSSLNVYEDRYSFSEEQQSVHQHDSNDSNGPDNAVLHSQSYNLHNDVAPQRRPRETMDRTDDGEEGLGGFVSCITSLMGRQIGRES